MLKFLKLPESNLYIVYVFINFGLGCFTDNVPLFVCPPFSAISYPFSIKSHISVIIGYSIIGAGVTEIVVAWVLKTVCSPIREAEYFFIVGILPKAFPFIVNNSFMDKFQGPIDDPAKSMYVGENFNIQLLDSCWAVVMLVENFQYADNVNFTLRRQKFIYENIFY